MITRLGRFAAVPPKDGDYLVPPKDGDYLVIFFVLLACYAYFLPRWADWNQNSRFDLVRAVVEKNTLAIDAYAGNTGDTAAVDGHLYSDKAPGLSFAAIPVYGVVNWLARLPAVRDLIRQVASSPAFVGTLNEQGSGLLDDKVHAALGLTVATFWLVMLPSAGLGMLIHALLGHLNFSRPVRVATPLIYGLATLAFPYSSAFYGHQFTAVLLFGAFYLAFRMRRRPPLREGRQVGPRAMLAIGFLLSYTVVSEYPTALIAAAVAIYAVTAVPNRGWTIAAILAGLPPLILLGLYHAAIFGTPFALGYQHSTLWAGEHRVGFLSLGVPTVEALWGITFASYRGLYFVAPILLLTLARPASLLESARMAGRGSSVHMGRAGLHGVQRVVGHVAGRLLDRAALPGADATLRRARAGIRPGRRGPPALVEEPGGALNSLVIRRSLDRDDRRAGLPRLRAEPADRLFPAPARSGRHCPTKGRGLPRAQPGHGGRPARLGQPAAAGRLRRTLDGATASPAPTLAIPSELTLRSSSVRSATADEQRREAIRVDR